MTDPCGRRSDAARTRLTGSSEATIRTFATPDFLASPDAPGGVQYGAGFDLEQTGEK